jgi:hypothetical protein
MPPACTRANVGFAWIAVIGAARWDDNDAPTNEPARAGERCAQDGAQAQNAAGFVVAFTRSPRVAVAHVRSDHADLTALLTVPVYRAGIIHP